MKDMPCTNCPFREFTEEGIPYCNYNMVGCYIYKSTIVEDCEYGEASGKHNSQD